MAISEESELAIKYNMPNLFEELIEKYVKALALLNGRFFCSSKLSDVFFFFLENKSREADISLGMQIAKTKIDLKIDGLKSELDKIRDDLHNEVDKVGQKALNE